ncbi:hypothetical protein J4213_02585 [Candidatus Woesearchaeota archaeon]|nr:hypothetical protein [uncultured archaeon]AQS28738.1 hypothetical protein [uncultured archaeon]MBS3160565.1 hypothetical protein [Candidatus Woesearchaeota archaeon]
MMEYFDLRQEAYNKTIELNKSGLSWYKISNHFDELGYKIPHSTIRSWTRGSKARNKEPLINFSSSLSKEESYALGVIGPGDGYIADANYEIGLAVIDKDFADYFQFCLEKVFRLRTSNKLEGPSGLGKNPRYRVKLYSKKICEYLTKRYKVNFKEESWRIPEIIKESNEEIKGAYLSGFSDSQGHVSKREIILASKNVDGLKEIKCLLDSLDILFTLSENKGIISIYGKNSFEIFNNKIGFATKRKADKLICIINSYKRNMTPKKIINNKMIEIIKYLKEGNTKLQASKIFGVHRLTISKKLKEMGVD